jgi:hypothetical protein
MLSEWVWLWRARASNLAPVICSAASHWLIYRGVQCTDNRTVFCAVVLVVPGLNLIHGIFLTKSENDIYKSFSLSIQSNSYLCFDSRNHSMEEFDPLSGRGGGIFKLQSDKKDSVYLLVTIRYLAQSDYLAADRQGQRTLDSHCHLLSLILTTLSW